MPQKSTKSTRTRSKKQPVVATDQRERMIAEAAYYRAEQRQFAPGNEMQDWLEAEKEINNDQPAA